MLYDLNIPWSGDSQSLQKMLAFLAELNVNTVALNHIITGALPAKVISPIPSPLPFNVPKDMTVLNRCTLTISDPSLNHRLPDLARHYDIVAVRPTTEKAFLAACLTITDASIISLDLTQRYPFHFRPKPLMTAVKRGLRFELCYSQALQGGSTERRNVIMNVQSIVRATVGRGLVVSSEARSVLGVRAPADVGNLLKVWGLGQERAIEAQTVHPRAVVVNEAIRRSGFRGVVDVVDGGEKPAGPTDAEKKEQDATAKNQQGAKRKDSPTDEPPAMSKRQAKKLKLEALKAAKESGSTTPSTS